MIVVEHPALAALLKVAFEAMWHKGQTFDEVLASQAERSRDAVRSA
jgi:hypothetical protein